ncbi:hypothetical protein CSOJ01_12981 [Colletotrichum sojae]|uniref:Uncharacterized protein n=1 Tax=Colletotrichum sojae TaxID=2175907 RepID=A0A8H6MLP1_9PEZI|nr:hypothetical protein CSOJ01_12981 [Colletotrichum sojae]
MRTGPEEPFGRNQPCNGRQENSSVGFVADPTDFMTLVSRVSTDFWQRSSSDGSLCMESSAQPLQRPSDKLGSGGTLSRCSGSQMRGGSPMKGEYIQEGAGLGRPLYIADHRLRIRSHRSLELAASLIDMKTDGRGEAVKPRLFPLEILVNSSISHLGQILVGQLVNDAVQESATSDLEGIKTQHWPAADGVLRCADPSAIFNGTRRTRRTTARRQTPEWPGPDCMIRTPFRSKAAAVEAPLVGLARYVPSLDVPRVWMHGIGPAAAQLTPTTWMARLAVTSG